MKFAGNGRINRRDLNWLFGRKIGRPDNECWSFHAFVANTMMANSHVMNNIHDVKIFMNEYGITPTNWRKWFAEYNPDDEFVVIVDTQIVDKWTEYTQQIWVVGIWTYFYKGQQIGDWVNLDEDCKCNKERTN